MPNEPSAATTCPECGRERGFFGPCPACGSDAPSAATTESRPLAYPPETWEWFGSAAHLIVGSDCRFHLATLVGPWLVSTVGEWLPDSSSWDIYADTRKVTIEGRGDARRNDFLRKVGFVEIGAGRKYETMVFRTSGERCDAEDCDCGLPVVSEWAELDSDGYNERGAAQRGHYAMCFKVAALAPGEEPSWDE